ncbi:MAG: hypothetical protein V4495_20950 [Pseudomonadota bacterium]
MRLRNNGHGGMAAVPRTGAQKATSTAQDDQGGDDDAGIVASNRLNDLNGAHGFGIGEIAHRETDPDGVGEWRANFFGAFKFTANELKLGTGSNSFESLQLSMSLYW